MGFLRISRLDIDPDIGHGWNVLPLGCGGRVTGMFIANDGTMVCRTDVGNAYRWSGLTTDYADPTKTWVPLLNFTSLAGQGPAGGDPTINNFIGAWEHVLGPNHSSVHLAIFTDMQATSGKGWLWYSTNSGALWNQTNISFLNDSTNSNALNDGSSKTCAYKIAIDPANPDHAICGMPYNSGNSAGAYTTLNKAGGSTLATWGPVLTSGSTPIPNTATSNTHSSGLAFDPTSGTSVKFGGQTVTNRFIIPIPGSGIYETTDGGDTHTETFAAQTGVSDIWVPTGGFTAEGIYYCIVIHATVGGVWRYKSGTWARISGGTGYSASEYTGEYYLIIDPRNNPTSKAYLSVFGRNGFGVGYTSQNANTAVAASVTWTGATGGQIPALRSQSYDIYYINDLFGQGSGAFTDAIGAFVDPNGVCWWPGNQSLFYVGVSSANSTPAGPPIYSNTGSANTIASWSMGRGMEATVAEDILCSPGATYPVLAVEDLGAPMRGKFVGSGSISAYPRTIAIPLEEWTCESLEYAASDSSFIVARVTGQGGPGSVIDDSRYSTNYGADGTWSVINDVPVYNATITAGISNGSGSAGFILNVTACSGKIRETAYITASAVGGGAYYGIVQPYGTSGTTGTGGTGTYILDTSTLLAPGTSIFSTQYVQGGHTVAVDHDHWVTVPSGYGSQSYIPNYTANATGAATWADCAGLPSHQWTLRGWTFGKGSKPFAVGYGADLNTVWAWQVPSQAAGTATLYRSTNSGASFSSIGTQSVGIATLASYCLSVPGFPNELWVSAAFVGGGAGTRALWHVTNANTSSATFTAVNLPSPMNAIIMVTLGAPATPGGYPAIYIVAQDLGSGNPPLLYRGTYPGTGSTVTWALFGPTGGQKDLPPTCALQGYAALRADWNVYGRIYVATQACGLAYYNP